MPPNPGQKETIPLELPESQQNLVAADVMRIDQPQSCRPGALTGRPSLSQRDYVTQPSVAVSELRWVNVPNKYPTLKRLRPLCGAVRGFDHLGIDHWWTNAAAT